MNCVATKPSLMSVRNKNSMRWMDNDEWYYIDDERDRFVLTDKAPEEARKSFEEFKRINNVGWDD